MQRPTDENHYEDGYDAIGAQADYEQKREVCRRWRKRDDPELYALVKEKLLEQQWSPEQIQYRLRHENSQHSISSATIYRAIYTGLFNDPDWVRSGKRNLRHRGKKRLYKGAKITRGGFAIRKGRFLRCSRLEKKTADGVSAAIIEALSGEILHSITPDRGKEFARHAEVIKALGAEFYFPPPYQPWQRGTNENTNGLLREFFPKHQDIAQYSDEYIEKCVWKLNNRPRKCLQWRTPYEVHFEKALHLV